MRAEAIDYRFVESDPRRTAREQQHDNLMTPARRAGLEALEREFSEYLKARSR
jgi:hypothetical protein